MKATSPELAVEMMDKAFNEGNLDSVLSFYEDRAVVVTEPGKLVRGKQELGSFFELAMASGARATQLRTQVIEAEGIALFLSHWTLTTDNLEGTSKPKRFTATGVFRKQSNGEWKALIDNSIGPLVLGPD